MSIKVIDIGIAYQPKDCMRLAISD